MSKSTTKDESSAAGKHCPPVNSPTSSMNDSFFQEVNNASWGNTDFDSIIGSIALNDEEEEEAPLNATTNSPERDEKSNRARYQAPRTPKSSNRQQRSACHAGSSCSPAKATANSPGATSRGTAPLSTTNGEGDFTTTPPKSSTRRSIFSGRSPSALSRLRAAFVSQGGNHSSPRARALSEEDHMAGAPADTTSMTTTPKRHNRTAPTRLANCSPGTLGRLRPFRSYNEKTTSSPPKQEEEGDSTSNTKGGGLLGLAAPKRFASLPTTITQEQPRQNIVALSHRSRLS